jgi:hypothetical protein
VNELLKTLSNHGFQLLYAAEFHAAAHQPDAAESAIAPLQFPVPLHINLAHRISA